MFVLFYYDRYEDIFFATTRQDMDYINYNNYILGNADIVYLKEHGFDKKYASGLWTV
jgi:hypothetical protein